MASIDRRAAGLSKVNQAATIAKVITIPPAIRWDEGNRGAVAFIREVAISSLVGSVAR